MNRTLFSWEDRENRASIQVLPIRSDESAIINELEVRKKHIMDEAIQSFTDPTIPT